MTSADWFLGSGCLRLSQAPSFPARGRGWVIAASVQVRRWFCQEDVSQPRCGDMAKALLTLRVSSKEMDMGILRTIDQEGGRPPKSSILQEMAVSSPLARGWGGGQGQPGVTAQH